MKKISSDMYRSQIVWGQNSWNDSLFGVKKIIRFSEEHLIFNKQMLSQPQICFFRVWNIGQPKQLKGEIRADAQRCIFILLQDLECTLLIHRNVRDREYLLQMIFLTDCIVANILTTNNIGWQIPDRSYPLYCVSV